jgi:peptide chain release factor 1
MYQRHARKRGWEIEVLETRGEGAALRFAVFEVSGEGAARLHQEAGAHSIQHLTRSRKDNRVHTSTATVAVFAPVKSGIGESLVRSGDIRVDTFRGSGKGGQHRNVTDSAVRVLHLPSGEMATVTSGRSQTQNRALALSVLLGRLRSRERERELASAQRQRSAQTQAQRAKAIRVYDLVRDMVRCADGRKVKRVRNVLDGDLDAL